MNRAPTTPSGRPLDIYPHGRAAAREILHDVQRRAGTAPIIDTLLAAAAHHTRGNPWLTHVAASDAAFLIAHAAQPTVDHALNGQVPALLLRVDRLAVERRNALLAAAQRAADPQLSLTAPTRSPATRLTTVRADTSEHRPDSATPRNTAIAAQPLGDCA